MRKNVMFPSDDMINFILGSQLGIIKSTTLKTEQLIFNLDENM